MKKLIRIASIVALLLLGLTGCGRPTLSVKNHQLKPDGLAAVIKGQSSHKQIRYRINNGSAKTESTNNGSFALTIPATTQSQRVVLSAGGVKQTVKVGKVNSLTTYQKLQRAYNQATIATALSKADQKRAAALQTQGTKLKREQVAIQQAVAVARKKLAKGDTSAAATLQAQAKKAAALKQQAAAMKQTQQMVEAAMKDAKSKVANQLLPTKSKDGIHNLVTTKDVTIRMNQDRQQVTGIAMLVPVAAMKDKVRAKNFGLSFSILANSVGADAKQIMKDFQKQAKSKKTTKTTTKALHSNGVDFRIGYSTTTLYIYITK